MGQHSPSHALLHLPQSQQQRQQQLQQHPLPIMRIPFIKDSKQQHQRQQRREPEAAPMTPIHIMEILETIFSFLDEVTIRQTVVFVRRQWFLIARHCVAREVVWNGSGQAKKLKRKIYRLPGAGRLTWHWDLYTSDEKGCWEPLTAALKVCKKYALKELEKQQGSGSGWKVNWAFGLTGWHGRRGVSLDAPLRRLEFHSHKVQESRFSQLPYPPSLSSIKIQMAQTFTLDMDVVLGLVLYWSGFMQRSRSVVPSSSRDHGFLRKRVPAPYSCTRWFFDGELSIVQSVHTLVKDTTSRGTHTWTLGSRRREV